MDKWLIFTEGDVRTYSKNFHTENTFFSTGYNRNVCLILGSLAKEVPGYVCRDVNTAVSVSMQAGKHISTQKCPAQCIPEQPLHLPLQTCR